MTQGPIEDDDDEVPGIIEELWDGERSWLGAIIEVGRSVSPDGDVTFTLPPQCFTGVAADGSGFRDVAVPLSLLRWLMERYPRDSGQSEGSSS